MRDSIGMAAALLPLLLAFAAGCQGSGALDAGPPGETGRAAWAMAGGDSLRQGRTTLSGPQQGSRQWSVSLEGYIRYSPTIAPDGTIYLAQGKAVSAFSPAGEELWRYSAADSIVAPPHLDASGLIWGVSRGRWVGEDSTYEGAEIFALHPDGTLDRWFDTVDANPKRAAFDAAGAIYILADTRYTDDDLLCVEPNGEERWRVSSDGFHEVSWFAAAGGVVSFMRDWILFFYDAADGIRLGEIDLSEQEISGYAVDASGGVYMAKRSDSPDDCAIKKILLDGSVLWETPVDLHDTSGQLYLGRHDQLYIVDADDALTALSPAGKVIWRHPQAGNIVGLAPDGTAYTILKQNTRFDLNVIAPDGALVKEVPDTVLNDYYRGLRPDYLGELPLVAGGDGLLLWRSEMPGSSRYYPYGLHALDANGAVLWSRVDADLLADGVPLIDSAGNCYAANSNTLSAVGTDGGFRWSCSSLDAYQVAPVLLNDELIVTATRNNDLSAYNMDGSLAWQTSLGGYSDYQGLASGAGRVYLASGEFLYCLDGSGQVRYQLALINSTYGAPAIAANGTAYLADGDGACNAVSRDGDLLWRVEIDKPGDWDYPVIAGPEQILFALAGGTLALDSQGNELWRMTLDQPAAYSSAPAVGEDGTLYLPIYVTVQSTEVSGNWLYALDSAGSVRWQVELENKVVQQPVVDGSGLIYMRDWDFQLIIVSPSGTILAGADQEQPAFSGISRGWRALGIGPGMQLLTCGDSLESYGL